MRTRSCSQLVGLCDHSFLDTKMGRAVPSLGSAGIICRLMSIVDVIKVGRQVKETRWTEEMYGVESPWEATRKTSTRLSF